MRNRGHHGQGIGRSGGSGVPAAVPVRVRQRARRSGDEIRFTWEVLVGTGSRRVVAGTCATEALARARAGEVAAEIAAGVLEDPATRPGTVGELMASWEAGKAADRRLRRSTQEHAKWVAKPVSARLGELGLAVLTRATVEGYIRARLADGRSAETVHDEVRGLREALGLAVARGWWKGDPGALCAGHGLAGHGLKEWLRADEVGRLVKACTDPYHRIAVRIALGTGLRVSEITALQWRDWQAADRVLTVRPKAIGGVIWQPKDSDRRVVPVDENLAGHIEAWRTRRVDEPEADAFMVATRDGEHRATIGWFAKKTREACDSARVRHVSFHGLRHTFATLWLQHGGDLFRLSRILGHYSPEFTARQYAHVCSSDLVRTADQVQRRIVQGVAKGVTWPVTCDMDAAADVA